MIVLFIGINLCIIPLFCFFWEYVLSKIRTAYVGLWHQISVGVIIFLDIVLVLFILVVNVGAIRSAPTDVGSLTGFFVPGGRVLFAASVSVPSINNTYSGDLTVTWKDDAKVIHQDSYGFGGGKPSKIKVVELDTTIIRVTIKIPDSIVFPTTLAWELNGHTTIFADRNGVKGVYAGGPGGGTIWITVDEYPFTVSGEVTQDAILKSYMIIELLKWKEAHRLVVWLACLVLLFLNYGCFMRAKVSDSLFKIVYMFKSP